MKMQNTIISVLLCFIVFPLFAQVQVLQNESLSFFTISGYIRDKETGENILGANIFNALNNTGTTTNEYGFYSITVPKGKACLQFSYVGYNTQNRELELSSDIKLNIELVANKELGEVIVYGKYSNTGINAIQMGAIDIPTDLGMSK